MQINGYVEGFFRNNSALISGCYNIMKPVCVWVDWSLFFLD